MIKHQQIHHFINNGSNSCQKTKIPYSHRFIRRMFKYFSYSFREKVLPLFRAMKSQYFKFLKYWLFFEKKNLTINTIMQ